MRKAKPRKRIILPDPKYNDVLVTKFVNNLMLGGKKTLAYKIFYEAIDVVADRTKEDGIEVWKKALANITPSVEVKSRRIGGATFQVPTEIRPERKQSIGMKNLISFSRKRSEKTMALKLLPRFRLLTRKRVPPSSVKRISTVWPRPTRLSRTSVSKII